MKALLCGVLCAGLLSQAPLHASDEGVEPGLGHAGVGFQRDDADGDSTALSLALPLSSVWYLNASRASADNSLDSSGGSETVAATSTRFGVSLDREGWGGSLSLLRYDDDLVLETRETQLMLNYRGKQMDFGLELAARSHDVFVDMPEPLRDREESFDSRGVGVHLGISADTGLRVFGGWQQYTYDDARVLDPDFGSRLIDYPRLYSLLTAQRDQADGALVDHNAWLGVDIPIAKHLLTFEHAFSELEVDGSAFSTDTAILALNLNDHWGLDLSASISRGDNTDDIRFAGVTLHLFW